MGKAANTARRLKEIEGYLELGLPGQALEVLDSWTPPAELEFAYCMLRGETLKELGRYSDALVPLERAVVLEPKAISTYFALGWCYKRTGQLHRAIEAMRTAHRLKPKEGLAQYNLACYLSLAGQVKEAVHWLGRALAIDPKMRKMVATETDFDPIRHHAEFEQLMGHTKSSSLPEDVA